MLALRRRVQMVFQDPYASLNARMTAGDIISEPWRTHKTLYQSQARSLARVRELLQLVGLRPSDEHRSRRSSPAVSASGSASPGHWPCARGASSATSRCRRWTSRCRRRCSTCSTSLQQELGISYIFISHDLSVVRHVADRVAVMYLGRIVETGDPESLFAIPHTPTPQR